MGRVTRHFASWSTVLAAGLIACSYPPLSRREIEVKDTPVTANLDLDLLFMVDDSNSMSDKQANLADNFPGFIAALDSLPNGRPNLHIGVVTSDLGSKGTQDDAPGPTVGIPGTGGCSGTGKAGNLQLFGAPVTGTPFVVDVGLPDGTRMTNYTGSLSSVFATMAKVGNSGCGFEQSLQAVRQALDNNPANAGFLRPDAYLGIIIITDEDDCSMTHSALLVTDTTTLGPLSSFRCTQYGVLCGEGGTTTEEMNQIGPKSACHPNDQSAYLTDIGDHASFLKGLKADPSKVIVAGIMGTTEPFAVELRPLASGSPPIPSLAHSCTYLDTAMMPEVADPPVRIKALLDQFPGRSVFAPICQRDLSGGLQPIVDLLKSAAENVCIDGTLGDVDPDTAGVQARCDVSVVTAPGTPAETASELARCTPEDASATNPPCWRLDTDPAACPRGDHAALKIEGTMLLPKDAHVVAKCVVDV